MKSEEQLRAELSRKLQIVTIASPFTEADIAGAMEISEERFTRQVLGEGRVTSLLLALFSEKTGVPVHLLLDMEE